MSEPVVKKLKDDAPEPALPRAEFPDRYGWAARVCTEEDAGIRCYLGDAPGYDGILKQRYEDFFVREVDMQSHVVRLTDEAIPVDVDPDALEPGAALELLTSLAGAEAVAAVQAALAASTVTSVPVTNATATDKAARTQLHRAVKYAFAGAVTSSTRNGELTMQTGTAAPREERAHSSWPRHRPPFVQFALYKENVETNRAINDLATACRCSPKDFAWAGTKDKRAVTCQWVTVQRVTPERLLAAAKRLRGIRVGNFSFVAEPAKFGATNGNNFEVALRFVSAPPSVLDASVAQLCQTGFINYYGLQRFGATAVPTHVVGLALLRNDWVNAVDLILAGALPGAWNAARNATAALNDINSRVHHAEKTLLDALHRSPRDSLGALMRLPGNLRTLYLHAYQAFVWNIGASARLERGSRCEAEVGDLVLVQAEAAQTEDEDLSFQATVRVLETVEEARAVSLADVVLPLPGTAVTMPPSFVGEAMRARLVADGVPLEEWPAKAQRFPIKGGYRHLVCRPAAVEHRVVHYDDPTVPLLLSDAQKLDGRAPPVSSGAHTALCVSFNLPAGSYATMCFRELQKRPSDRVYQDTMTARWSAEGAKDGDHGQ